MKRIVLILLVICMVASILVSCGHSVIPAQATTEEAPSAESVTIAETTTEEMTTEEMTTETATDETLTETTTPAPASVELEDRQKKALDVMETADDPHYNVLKQKLNDVLSSKSFDNQSQEAIKTIVEKLYLNYDNVQRIYKQDGMRDKNKYISDLMDTIDKNVEGFVYVKTGAKDRYARKLGYSRAIYVTGEKKIVAADDITAEDLVAILLHEITHSQQRKILTDRRVPAGMKQVLVEGEAAASSVLLESTMPFFSNVAISNEDETISHYISGLSNTDYAAYSKYYLMLGHAAGFDVLEKMKDGYDEDCLIRAIEAKYDIDGKQFIEDMDTSASILTRTYHSDDLIESTRGLETSYLKLISEDIKKADSKEKVQNVLNVYRHYKLQYKMQAYDSECRNIENAFGEKDAERKLYDKIVDYEVLPADLSSELFYLIMYNYSDYSPYFVRDDIVENIRYTVDGNTIMLVGKNSEDMILYDRKTKDITNDEASEKTYDKSKCVLKDVN